MAKTFFVSDLHFNHKNILRYEPSRIDATLEFAKSLDINFPAKEEILADYSTDSKTLILLTLKLHDEMLIKRWNSVVSKNDTVWFLGDLGMGNKEYLKSLVGKLNGIKKMIMGNHDNFSEDFYKECGFTFVSKYPIILKNFFVLSHHPLEWMHPASSPFYFIYGHVHSLPQFNTETENSRCVCVERQGFAPIEIEAFNQYQEEKEGLQ